MALDEAGEAQRRSLRLLGLGAAAGLLCAAVGLLRPAAPPVEMVAADAVARVNGTAIRRADYERLLAGLQRDTRTPIDDKSRARILDRMIEEELLVQRALELGLATVDRRVRANLTSSLIASIVTEADAAILIRRLCAIMSCN